MAPRVGDRVLFGRRQHRPPRLALLGYGRAGKDTAGGWFGLFTGLTYVGSTSRAICPMVAASLGLSPEAAWNERHKNRMYWYDWANNYRRDDPAKIAKACLEKGDLVVGLRDVVELRACKEQGLFDLTVWVENPRVEKDPTVTFTSSDCDLVVVNEGDLPAFYRKLERLCGFAGLDVHPWATLWRGPTVNEQGDWLGPLSRWRHSESEGFTEAEDYSLQYLYH